MVKKIDNNLVDIGIDFYKRFKKIVCESKDDYRKCFINQFSIVNYQNVYPENTFNINDFDEYYEKVLVYVDKQISFLKDVNALNVNEDLSNLNKYMIKIIDNMHKSLSSIDNIPITESCFFQAFQYPNFSRDYKALLYLDMFSKYPENIILIGANGCGKSSFADCLKGDDTEFITVIPAQKNLFFSVQHDLNLLSSNKETLSRLLLENNIGKSKLKNDAFDFFNYANNQFTRLILQMQSEYIDHLCEWESQKKNKETLDLSSTVLYKVQEVYRNLFPDIKLEFMNEKTLFCRKNGHVYTVNGLSEGEKAVIYYSSSVFFAKPDSCIIVDEPETYMNPSLTNLLWDLLTYMRKDCQFIFITHNVDFVLGQGNAKIAWIKDFVYPDEWNFQILDDNTDLPKNMMTEILGAKKPILFCEGNNKSSLDYRAYNAILGDLFTIVPVHGHHQVIQNCKAVNKLNLNYACYGIIDGDENSDSKISNLNKNNILVLPFNEIEMFLLENRILTSIMKHLYPLDGDKRVLDFKYEFWNCVSNNIDTIVLKYVKGFVDETLERKKISNFKSLDEIKRNLENLSRLDINKVYDSKKKELNEIIEKKDYKRLLKVCNLKKQITKDIAPKILDRDFENKVIQHIMFNDDLKKYLKDSYFKDLQIND